MKQEIVSLLTCLTCMHLTLENNPTISKVIFHSDMFILPSCLINCRCDETQLYIFFCQILFTHNSCLHHLHIVFYYEKFTIIKNLKGKLWHYSCEDLSKSLISTFKTSAISSKFSRDGCTLLVHHRETVFSVRPISFANHLPDNCFSAKTALILFIAFIC